MSRPWIAKDNEGNIDVDALLTETEMEGNIKGVNAAVTWLMKRAAGFFELGLDDQANSTRLLSHQLTDELVKTLLSKLVERRTTTKWRIEK